MISLNLPPFPTNTTLRSGHRVIFDRLRHRYVRLTPEEWVRQHFVNYLIVVKGYPAGLLANEVSISLSGTQRRCDTVLYDRIGGKPRMIVEYKAPTVDMTQAVFTQIAAYNSVLRADYLVVSNGLRHFCCQMNYDNMSISFLQDIPSYSSL